MGAFYPLLLLRPLEAERPEPGQLLAALSALEKLCGQAQFLVSSPAQLMTPHSQISKYPFTGALQRVCARACESHLPLTNMCTGRDWLQSG